MPYKNTVTCLSCGQSHELYYRELMNFEYGYSFICPSKSNAVSVIPASPVEEVSAIPSDAICPKRIIPPAEILRFKGNATTGWVLIHPHYPIEGIRFDADDHDKYLAGGNEWKHKILRQLAQNPQYGKVFEKWQITFC